MTLPRGLVDGSPAADQATERFADELLSATESHGARRLAASWPTTPQFSVERECDAAALVARRDALREELAPLRVSLTVVLISCVAQVLRRHGRLNSQFHDGARRIFHDVNIGIAVATDRGLTVPVIRSADRLSERDIALELDRITTVARAGQLKLQDVSDGTFTITNLGMLGVDVLTPIVNPPQAAILGVGRVRDRVVAVDRRPLVRPSMTITLCADHRIVDGVAAGQFLGDLVTTLEGV